MSMEYQSGESVNVSTAFNKQGFTQNFLLGGGGAVMGEDNESVLR